jgi:hypothetical protein
MTAPAQLALDLSPLREPDYTPELTLDERYALWIDANPHVLDAFEHMAATWLARRPRVGVKALAEVIRWKSDFETTPDATGWKINNSYVSRIARDLVRRHPEWDHRIERRALAKERPGYPR